MLEMTLKAAFNTSSRACGLRFALLAISAPVLSIKTGSTSISARAISYISYSKKAQKTAGFYSPLLRIQSAV